MPLNVDSGKRQVSFPKLPYPAYREVEPRSPQLWMKGKRLQDGAEGLWRIHDSLYDLTDFVPRHPGGADWISMSKGTDITEQFETHHLKGIAEGMLPEYFVRKTSAPRNYPFTFREDGFYKTLKVKVMDKLKKIPDGEKKRSHSVTDSFFVAFLVLLPATAWSWAYGYRLLGATMTVITAFVMCSLAITGHNYMHQADSWRMYFINLTGMTYKDWRIAHAMSHHMHTNTVHDVEMNMAEPIVVYPAYRHKGIVQQMMAFIYPILFMFVFLALYSKEIILSATNFEGKRITWGSLVPLTVPAWIWLTGGLSIKGNLLLWLAIVMFASFFYAFHGLTAGHHSDACFFECDISRDEYVDWGLHQLDTIIEKVEYAGNHFKSITRFGDHGIHHLFPTLDHALLNYMYPILFEHMEKFDVTLRMTTLTGAVLAHSKQILRKKRNNFSTEKTRPKHLNVAFDKEKFLDGLKNR